MKPVSHKVMPNSKLLQDVGFGTSNTVANIKGSVKKLGQQYQNATVVLYNKANLQPIAIRKPDADGNYQFLGLNTDLKTFIVAFDQKQQFNAVIQDNVVPK
ncbi:hypothetical protein [Acinetobacter radioresistens]|uniref:hypothetical protein n=1 Tax=Acinetobacter radioresistens TaxID=40216 RepID=UPI000E7658D2|nr:hypothetical protein [Acinetobacter radioresistens]RJL71968.1 hypothetical protein D5055_06880 [Acinetobacter radioresistens]